MAEILDLDAAVLGEFHREAISWAGSLAPERPRIVDLGAGSGTGSLALARQLPQAEVTAVDMDENMLAHLRDRAAEAGLADRIHTLRADLDGDWPDLGPVDLVWASASMHHMADPARTIAQVYAALRPGGAFVIAELESFPRFLGDPAGLALEDRCHVELDRLRAEAGMHMKADWAALLTAAGFAIDNERRFDLELKSPLPPPAVRYAQLTLERVRDRLSDLLSADDLSALDAYAATVGTRTDLTIRATRMVWAARRP